jgi:hypothetical protein
MKYCIYIIAAILGLVSTVNAQTKKALWENEFDSADAACRSKLDLDQIDYDSSKGDGPRVAHCFCQDKEDKFPKYYCNTVTQGPEESGGNKPSPEEEVAKQVAVKDETCKEIASLFDQTLKEELPPAVLNEAVVAVAKVITTDNKPSWIAGSSAFYGAPYGIGYTKDGKKMSSSKYNYYARGIRIEDEGPIGSYIVHCESKEKYKYVASARRYQGHAESKIIEDWFQSKPTAGSKMYIEIRGTWDEPCPQCGRLVDFVNEGGDECPKVVVCPSTQPAKESSK